MITSFKAANFKCFEHLELSELRRVNLIVGANASGKTAILEAIRLATGANPQIAMQVRRLSFVLPINPSREAFEAAWFTLFFGQDINRTISFTYKDSFSITKSLNVFFDKTRAFTPVPTPESKSINGPMTIVPLKFDRTIGTLRTSVYATVTPEGLPNFQSLPELGPVTGFFASTHESNVQEIAQMLSRLSLQGKEGDILKFLKKLFSYINEVSVLTLMPGQASVYISQSGSSIKLPSTMVSAGVNKFLSLIIGLSSHHGGVALVDEIDNGFYYKTLPEIWSILLRLTKESDAQIFASTHSWECLKAALPAMHDDADAFALIRTSKSGFGCTAEVICGDDVRSAIEEEIEVR